MNVGVGVVRKVAIYYNRPDPTRVDSHPAVVWRLGRRSRVSVSAVASLDLGKLSTKSEVEHFWKVGLAKCAPARARFEFQLFSLRFKGAKSLGDRSAFGR